jgi:uncharacterized protein
MTNEERDLITQFITRVSGAQAPAQPAFGAGSVPATTTPALPPVDPDADRLIKDLFNRYLSAPYRITQLAFVQEHALTEAQNRIQRLEWELQQAQQALQQAQQTQQQQQQSGGTGGGFFGGLFGGGSRSAPPPQQGAPVWNQGAPQQGYAPQAAPPPPQYAPSYQPGMFQRQGSGFLGSALTTAAGVAGGMVAGNALMNLFSGSHNYGGGFGGGYGGFGQGAPMVGGPWGSTPADPGYTDQGTWDTSTGAAAPTDPGYVDNGTWDTSGTDQSLTDNSGGDAGWDTGGGGGGGSDDDTF